MGDSQEVKKERGWGLTIVIPLTILGASLTFVSVLIDIVFLDDIYSELPRISVIWYMIQLGLIVVCLIGAWRWKRWGCFGLIALTIIGAVINLIGGIQPFLLLGSLISIIFLYAVYRSKEQYFE